METPEFIKKIDWSELRNQKTCLVTAIEYFKTVKVPEIPDGLEGILNLIDALQDYAVDTAQIVKDIDVYDFETEEQREAETVNEKFARESADNIFMELRESEFFHTDGEMSTEFIEGIMADDKHEAVIKGLIRMQILEDVNSQPTEFKHENNIPVYDANMREDYEGIATNYCREIWKSKQTRMTLVCTNCGSENVQTKYWINPNTKELFDLISYDQDDCWCENCQEHHRLELKEV